MVKKIEESFYCCAKKNFFFEKRKKFVCNNMDSIMNEKVFFFHSFLGKKKDFDQRNFFS